MVKLKKTLKNILNGIGLTSYYPKQNISFSQTGEDLIIRFIFGNILKIQKPTYIDIGAHDPFWLNNTVKFYLNGSRGINIEPDPILYKKFLKHRKNDINLNCAVSNKKGTQKYYIMSTPTVNTLNPEEAKKYDQLDNNISIEKEIDIRVETITDIVNKYFDNNMPDLLTIDVEGYEYNILKTIDFSFYRPKIMCVETAEIDKNNKPYKKESLIEFIKEKDYFLYADTGINSIFIDKKISPL